MNARNSVVRGMKGGKKEPGGPVEDERESLPEILRFSQVITQSASAFDLLR